MRVAPVEHVLARRLTRALASKSTLDDDALVVGCDPSTDHVVMICGDIGVALRHGELCARTGRVIGAGDRAGRNILEDFAVLGARWPRGELPPHRIIPIFIA